MSRFPTIKKDILAEVQRRKDEVVRLCCDLVRIPSENPPGDTTQIASFLTTYLEERGIKVKRYEPKKGIPNLVATIEGSAKEPNLVLNAHMDEFPAEVGKPWEFPARAGQVKQGKLLGRGSSDMKGGLAASLFAFTVAREMGIAIPGTVTLTLVSDEETGGKWGTEWLLDNVPGIQGDACLSGEPTGTDKVQIGEKGLNWVRLTAAGVPAHGAYPYPDGGNAILNMAKALVAAQTLEQLRGAIPRDMEESLEHSRLFRELEAGKGAGRIIDHVTVNVGTIRGGVKINMVPGYCEAELDIRVPMGIGSERIRFELDKRFTEAGIAKGVNFSWIGCNEAVYTSPNNRFVRLVRDNVRLQTGKEPRTYFDPGGSDLRFYARKGIPIAVFGPRSYGMAAENEHITVADLLTVTLVHAGTLVDYFDL